MIINPWHGIKPGPLAPARVNAVIEIPHGSKAKYEIDKENGLLRLDRIVFSELTYPANYGFIPQTYADDGDPLDIIVMCSQTLEPRSFTEVTVLGAIAMLDSGQRDDKIISAVANDPYLRHLKTLADVPSESIDALLFFFEHYKKRENKKIEILNVMQQPDAHNLIKQSIKNYINKFDPK
jgi:inorganic pyrophosphatase